MYHNNSRQCVNFTTGGMEYDLMLVVGKNDCMYRMLSELEWTITTNQIPAHKKSLFRS